ncbi:YciI family protein [Verticiella sediminum]|uniref:YciI family protein n=1 Tax=Verticiella sediminum TaxID=1247510 RepID=A0A556B0E7_9BURK|nr:YciI family protein [Verticiella sediminum]TSH98661.1 YciI family protein [Verticiella sediminum]
MPYLIETFDKPGTLALRQATRTAHLAYLDAHEHLLLACGAKLQDDGSDLGGGVYILDVDTRQAADAFLRADPFYAAGLFERYQIVRWRKAYLDGRSYL